MCQAIASPSRSGSVASSTSSALSAACLSSWTTFSFPGTTSYVSWKPFSMSTPSFFGRSLMCPFDARTSNFDPRYFLMVLAFAGDSTTTSVFTIVGVSFVFRNNLRGLDVVLAAEEPRRAFYYYVLQGERQERCGRLLCG